MCRAQLFILAYSNSFSASAAYRSRLGKRQQKKPAPQSYLEVKALACPKNKDKESSACFMGTQCIRPALFRSNLRDSHFQTGGIATDYMPQIYTFFVLAMKKCYLRHKKNRYCFSRYKSRGFG